MLWRLGGVSLLRMTLHPTGRGLDAGRCRKAASNIIRKRIHDGEEGKDDLESSADTITIGDVTKVLRKPRHPELVPQRYVPSTDPDEPGHGQNGSQWLSLSQSTLHHLRWMLQKDALRQDMFLLGAPGSRRRQLAMQYLELTQRELEYIALSRDTTESDLKQRREIEKKAALYYDQCAVRAALHGRVLILDGVECAERNVLPILNNLLENREMHLENGKFLMAPERYDTLLQTYSQAELDSWGVLRVSEDFRVIALGCPTQKYKGTPLDPPLRSRFQSRNISHPSFEELLAEVRRVAPLVAEEKLRSLLSFGLAIQASDVNNNLPDFPLDNVERVAKMMNSNPYLSVHDALIRLYPYETFTKKEQQERIKHLLNSLQISIESSKSVERITVKKVSEENSSVNASSSLQFHIDNDVVVNLTGGGGQLTKMNGGERKQFVDLQHQRQILSQMIQAIAVGDICLVGAKGVGKTTLTQHLVDLLQQSLEPMILYEDMTSRDLIQQRITNNDGDTIWRDSPLVRAAKNGSIALLNGVNRLHRSASSVLQRLIHDRELQLCDGTILLRKDRYESLKREYGFSDLELAEKRIQVIHESFRLIALAEPPSSSTATTTTTTTMPSSGGISSSMKMNWLTPEMLNLFLYLEIRPLHKSEEYEIINQLYGNQGIQRIGSGELNKVINLSHFLRESKDANLQNLAGTLSTRQLLKIARRMSMYPMISTYDILENTFLMKFMPTLPRIALEDAMRNMGIEKTSSSSFSSTTTSEEDCLESGKIIVDTENNLLRIGRTEMKLSSGREEQEESKVPNTLFYEMPQHVMLLERLLQDYLMGDHLLLVGNQGVGKNKLVDKLLQLMRKPREYLQLHRDTTVHSLTVQATLKDGQVMYEDSPLVKAVRYGRILVIDEADKAPVNVTCILRTLVESGEMMLSDGRKIISTGNGNESVPPHSENIRTHPDFRVIVLANRPGFPFLGNDFFASLGDVFSCHAIDNPSPESEIYLLQQYGPSVPRNTLITLVNAFGELRQMADEGLLNYPYSTREVVSIVKHLERYPEENMSELIGNVLDFDRYQPETLEQVTGVLAKHGLAIEAYARNELTTLRRKRDLQLTVKRHSGQSVSAPKYGKVDPKNEPHVGGNTWAGGTGGRDTAGLGGKGGPFRLDAGHQVHQLSDEEKDDIPEEVKRAAREMNRRAFEEKLKEIRMSEHDHKLYSQFSEPIRKQVQQLKAILDAMQTKSKERQWQRYQTHGELDDTRLIEGITGEKNIYRRRAEANPWADHIQEQPNRLKLLVDVSGSMYRFNGYDGRLDRELEAVVMVMEAFDGYEKRILYDIVGHSGEGHEIPFVNAGKPPRNDKERFEIIRTMHAHSQFCWSGDSTVKATEAAVQDLAEQDFENNIVVVLSDANLSRYGIQPKHFAKALMSAEPKVKGHVIFIGSLAEEAELINGQMPAGHSYICLDVSNLPQILKQIFTSSLL